MKDIQSFLTRRELLSNTVKTGVVLAVAPRHLLRADAAASRVPAPFDSASSAKPWVYWMWLNGSMTAEGLTADLEAMHEIGIGGAIVLHLGKGPAGPVKFLSPEFQKLVTHLLADAARLGMQIDFNNDDGWDAAGPWVKPEYSMQKLVWTETRIAGGSQISQVLPQPETIKDYYREIATFAIPSPLGSGKTLPEPKLSWVPGSPSMVVHDYGDPIEVRSADVNINYESKGFSAPAVFTLEASDDGVSFRRVYHFDNRWRFAPLVGNRRIPVTVRFSAVRARYFRLVLSFPTNLKHGTSRRGNPSPDLENSFRLSAEDQISLWQYKAGHTTPRTSLEKPSRYPGGYTDLFAEAKENPPSLPDQQSIIKRASVVDLTKQSSKGHLQWSAPPGDWIVIRLGHTSTGRTNTPSSVAGRGLEIDYLSKAGLDNHFPNFMGLIAAENTPHVGKSLKAFHADSWESGPQTWTSNFAEEFERRRGYSMRPYLAVLTAGRIVDSLDQSERFLWDFRRTIADLIADNFWGYLTELCHKNGMLCSNEGSGYQQYMADPLLYLSKCDMPMGEFWVGESDIRPDCHLTSSVANTYRRQVAGAEAYTSTPTCGDPQAGQWTDHPYSLKAYGDRAFCIGVNQFIFHRSIHQPELNASPGRAWSGVGINMERTNTWWKPGAAWIAYLTRCQHLLQSGIMAADICVLVMEGVPNVLSRPEGLPFGFRYDGLHTELLSKMSVDHGDLVLPSGMRYRVLVLPDGTAMTPQVARQVGRLLKQGAVVVGQKPITSPSLSEYPACDRTLAEIASTWPRLFVSVNEALAHLALEPDFTSNHPGKPDDILYLHRRNGHTDVYFVSNQTSEAVNIDASFRVVDRAPSILDPDSGDTVQAGAFRKQGKRTIVPLILPPSGSVFVLFDNVAPREAIAEASSKAEGVFLADGSLQITASAPGKLKLRSTHGRPATIELAELPSKAIGGPWKLTFPPKWGAPEVITLDKLISWSEHPDEGVRHFSGSATYSTTFEVQAADLEPGRAIYLDLGDVDVIAELSLNGKALGTRWKPPFRYEVTENILHGNNTLAITVTNLWPNRLIGDSVLPPEKRLAKTNYNPYKPDSPLFRSGLIGPVVLSFAHRRIVHWA